MNWALSVDVVDKKCMANIVNFARYLAKNFRQDTLKTPFLQSSRLSIMGCKGYFGEFRGFFSRCPLL